MMKPQLPVQELLDRGFAAAGEWLLAAERLACGTAIPAEKGVYAFGLDNRIMYVGLASKSLAKRLYFYGKPGRTQATNIRLNRLISDTLRETQVSIYVASPPDFDWHGMPVRGPEGLEAGLIEKYDLPWNMRGRGIAVATPAATPIGADAPGLSERVYAAIVRQPRITETEIATQLFGSEGYQQKVNPVCRRLVTAGRVRRMGIGGPADPFIYVAA